MRPTHKILKFSPEGAALRLSLSRQLGSSAILAQLLINRGIKTEEQARLFLEAKVQDLLDPYSFADMRKAVELIRKNVKAGSKAVVFGDYDVDGITSTALLETVLSGQGLDVSHYLPHRIKEGYGLNRNILNYITENKIKLLITADCGISSHSEIEELKRHNIDVIVTDHHESANSKHPAADAVINPKTQDSGYRYRDLAGVGVAYKLCQAVSGKDLFEQLDLVALGTIADVVPLTGENRIMVKEGLSRLTDSKRAGIEALLESSGINDKEMSAYFISFILGPRLNAAGRMDSPETALNLLMSRSPQEARRLALLVEGHNRERQKIEGGIMDEAAAIIESEVNFKEHQVIVVARDNWHQGVLGIVASKLADRYYRPAIVISLKEGLCKGSARSIKNFHIFGALSECSALLDEFGGHAHAAGLVIDRNKVEEFRKAINKLAKEKLFVQDLLPSMDVDMEAGLADLNEKVAQELEMLEPYGAGNREPLFYTRNLRLKGQFRVMARNTLKFWVTDGNRTHQAIGFGLGGLKESITAAESFDLVYGIKIDRWQGANTLLLDVKDIFLK